jgi:phosphate transport system permease protein
MSASNFILIVIFLGVLSFFLGKNKAKKIQKNNKLHSLPGYYGYLSLVASILPFLSIFIVWSILENNIIQNLVIAKFQHLQNLSQVDLGIIFNDILRGDSPESLLYIDYTQTSNILKIISSFAFAIIGFTISYFFTNSKTRARNMVEKVILWSLISSAIIAIVTTAGIISSVVIESIQFFKQIPVSDFLFGTHWSPQIAIREDQVGGSGAFGALPIFWGTIFISTIAMLIAAPLGLSSAIYLSEYANSKVRNIVKPFLEILAGVPTVVYGFFAALTIGPMFRDFGNYLKEFGINFEIELFAGMSVSSESAIAAGVVMGMMVVPFVLSLSDDVLSAVPKSLRDGSTGLGATKSETVIKVLIPAALPGIIGGFLLAISRAIGETMIVLMAAGVAAKLSANPFDSVTTVTVQIVTLLTGDQEFDSVKTLAAFALGLGLFITTLVLNIIALRVVRKYREQYD